MIKKKIAISLAVILFYQTVHPLCVYALTSGPSQPEFSSFEPIGMTEMVDLFTGDFKYNIPLLNVPGEHGGYPINLFYNSPTSIEQEATMVGLGWNLGFGNISRTLRGIPDDFNGEEMRRRSSSKTEVSIAQGGTLGSEAFGFDVKKLLESGIDLSFKSTWSNYNGIGFELGVSRKLKYSILQGSAGINFNSLKGSSYNAGLKFYEENKEGSLSFGLNLSGNNIDGMNTLNMQGMLNGTINNQTTYLPFHDLQYVGKDFHFSAEGGMENSGIFGSVGALGTLSTNKMLSKNLWQSHPAYGTIYSQNSIDVGNAMLDFNRMKAKSIMENTSNLAYARSTEDIFVVSGHGTGGSFSYERSDNDEFRDRFSISADVGLTASAEVAAGSIVEVGADFMLSSSQRINNASNVRSPIKFKKLDNGETIEHGHFRKMHEMVGEITSPNTSINTNIDQRTNLLMEDYGYLYNDYLVRPNKSKSFLNARATANTTADVYSNGQFPINFPSPSDKTRQTRKPRTNSIVPILGKEIFSSSINDHNWPFLKSNIFEIAGDQIDLPIKGAPTQQPSYSNDDKVNGFIETLPNGQKYVYGIPVLNLVQQDYVASYGDANIDETIVPINGNTSNFHEVDIDGSNQFLDIKETPAYAQSYLLTYILGDNYIDVNPNDEGPQDGDKGHWVKFEYAKTNNYKWRFPYTGAQFNPVLHSIQKDNTISFTYGEREQYYPVKIETNSHIAKISYSTRNDGLGATEIVKGEGFDPALQYKVETIELWTKGETQIKEKTVHFDYYDQGLGKGFPNASAGKLALKEVYINNYNSTRGSLNPYHFKYFNDPDFTYKTNESDRWGCFQPLDVSEVNGVEDECEDDGDNHNQNYYAPYTKQDKTFVDENIKNFHLSSIQLPSGAKIKLGIERDHYGYVQDKAVTQMVKIAGIEEVCQSTIPKDDSQEYLLHFDIPDDFDSDHLSEYIDDLYEDSNGKQILFKIYSDLLNTSERSNPSSEFVVGAAYIDESGENRGISETIITEDGQQNKYATIKIKALHGLSDLKTGTENFGFHPFLVSNWQFLKVNGRTLLDPGIKAKFTSEDPSRSEIQTMFFKLKERITNAAAIFRGYYKNCYEREYGTTIDLDKSFIRVNVPNKMKYGGNVRVASVTMEDIWGANEEYGNVYDYTKSYTRADGTEGTMSTGVAQNEPQIGQEENGIYYIKDFIQEIKGTTDHLHYELHPFNDSALPGAQVGYSEVKVKSIATRDFINSDDNPEYSNTGVAVHEFYTAKDFPVIVEESLVDQSLASPAFVFLPFMTLKNKSFTGTQGYLSESNNMHGANKKTSYYSLSKSGNVTSSPISSVHYLYKHKKENYTWGKKVLERNRLVNDNIKLLTNLSENNQYVGELGVKRKLNVDKRYINNSSQNIGPEGNLNTIFVAVGIAPLPSIFPSLNFTKGITETSVMNKCIEKKGIIEKVIAFDGQSKVETENLVYDPFTGQAVQTSVTNEFDQKIYNTNIPAHLVYERMGPAYQNDGFMLTRVSENPSIDPIFTYDPCSGYWIHPIGGNESPFISGDQIMISKTINQDPSSQFSTRGYFIKEDILSEGGTQDYIFIDILGEPFANIFQNPDDINHLQYDLKVLSSGNNNLIGQSIQSVASLNGTIPGDASEFSEVLSASATTYNDFWNFKLNKVSQDEIERFYHSGFASGSMGIFRAENSLQYQAKRNQNTISNKKGLFEENVPLFNSLDPTDNNNWLSGNKITAYTKSGQVSETKNPLNIYSSRQFINLPESSQNVGITNTASNISGTVSNSRYWETAFSSFESYEYQYDDNPQQGNNPEEFQTHLDLTSDTDIAMISELYTKINTEIIESHPTYPTGSISCSIDKPFNAFQKYKGGHANIYSTTTFGEEFSLATSQIIDELSDPNNENQTLIILAPNSSCPTNFSEENITSISIANYNTVCGFNCESSTLEPTSNSSRQTNFTRISPTMNGYPNIKNEIIKSSKRITTACGKVDVINISTGFDEINAMSYPLVNPDGFNSIDPNWTLANVSTDNTGLQIGAPSFIVEKVSYWEPPQGANTSQYISPFNTNSIDASNLSPVYTLRRCFCVQASDSDINIDVSIHVDKALDLTLINLDTEEEILEIGSLPDGNSNYLGAPETFNSSIILQPGTYCIDAKLSSSSESGPLEFNTSNSQSNIHPMGLNILGSVSGTHIDSNNEVAQTLSNNTCCNPNSFITGYKHNDSDFNGVIDANSQTIAGWPITLYDQNGIELQSTITNEYGFYFFNVLNQPIGEDEDEPSYIVKEASNPDWVFSNPPDGQFSDVLVWFNKVIYLNFLNTFCGPIQPNYQSCAECVDQVVNFSDSFSHTGDRSLKVDQGESFTINNFSLDIYPGKEYLASCWVYIDEASLTTYNESNLAITVANTSLQPIGTRIDGWQQYRTIFTSTPSIVDDEVTNKTLPITLAAATTHDATYFDDFRITPYEAQVENYVYDAETFQLKYVLDDNNYFSKYIYDGDGNLVSIQKETERGIKSLQENRLYLAQSQITGDIQSDADCSSFQITIDEGNMVCDGQNANISVNGAADDLSYQWSNNSTSSSISPTGYTNDNQITTNSYQVTVTNEVGCIATGFANILVHPIPVISSVEISQGSCGTNNLLSIYFEDYLDIENIRIWINGDNHLVPIQQGQLDIELPAGTYMLAASWPTSPNCISEYGEVTIQGTENNLSVTTSGNDYCEGAMSTLTATPSFGSGNYFYQWSTGEHTSSISVSEEITGPDHESFNYQVTVVDELGCETISDIDITVKALHLVGIEIINADCQSNMGAIILTPNPLQTGELIFSTDGGNQYTSPHLTTAGPIILDLNPGEYSIIARWAESPSCQAELNNGNSVTILPAPCCEELSLDVNLIETSCGINNGAISVTATGSNPPFIYTWGNGEEGNIQDLSAGTYNLTITDSEGCVQTESYSISGSTAPICEISIDSNTSCGENNGAATATGTLGTPPYSYNWSDGSTTQNILNLEPGIYAVTITDILGCISTNVCSIEIEGSGDLLSCTTLINQHTSCNLSNGSATVAPSGGTSPYDIAWSNSGIGITNNFLSAGTHTVTITDFEGCSTNCAVNINSSSSPTCNILGMDATCGDTNGSATVAVQGGSSPYSYQWDNNQGTDPTIENLVSGIYGVTVTDSNGCTANSSITINNSDNPSCTFTNEVATSCGLNNGSVTGIATGGTSPYLFQWSNGATTATIDNLSPGAYSLTITDNLGCTSNCTINITNSTNINCTVSSEATSCGDSNGEATVFATDGTAPYNYNWSNGANTAHVENLGTGVYSVTVEDAMGCTTVCTTTIAGSTNPVCEISGMDASCQANNGSAMIATSGGIPPYSYLWSNGETSTAISNLSAGQYSITVTDANQCVCSATINIGTSTIPSCSFSMEQNSCSTTPNGSISYSNNANFSFSWDNGNETGTSMPITELAAATYSITVTSTDGNNCSNTCSVTVTDNFPPAIQFSNNNFVTCEVDENSISQNNNYCAAGLDLLGNDVCPLDLEFIFGLTIDSEYPISWSSSDFNLELINGEENEININGLASGTYTIGALRGSESCSSSPMEQFTLVIEPLVDNVFLTFCPFDQEGYNLWALIEEDQPGFNSAEYSFGSVFSCDNGTAIIDPANGNFSISDFSIGNHLIEIIPNVSMEDACLNCNIYVEIEIKDCTVELTHFGEDDGCYLEMSVTGTQCPEITIEILEEFDGGGDPEYQFSGPNVLAHYYTSDGNHRFNLTSESPCELTIFDAFPEIYVECVSADCSLCDPIISESDCVLSIVENSSTCDLSEANYSWLLPDMSILETSDNYIDASLNGAYHVTVTYEDGCTKTISITENCDCLPTITADGCTITYGMEGYCPQETFSNVLNLNNDPISSSINQNESNTYQVCENGFYTVSLINSENMEEIQGNAFYNLQSCECEVELIYDNCSTIQANLIGDCGNDVTYTWTLDGNSIPNEDESLLNISEIGQYQVVVSDENGCEINSSQQITNLPINIQTFNLSYQGSFVFTGYIFGICGGGSITGFFDEELSFQETEGCPNFTPISNFVDDGFIQLITDEIVSQFSSCSGTSVSIQGDNLIISFPCDCEISDFALFVKNISNCMVTGSQGSNDSFGNNCCCNN